MHAPNTISVEKLVRLVGTPKCPALIDVRAEDELDADPHVIPSPRHYTFEKQEISSEIPPGHPTVVICQKGASLSHGVAALASRQGYSCGGAGGKVSKDESHRNCHWFTLSKLPPVKP